MWPDRTTLALVVLAVAASVALLPSAGACPDRPLECPGKILDSGSASGSGNGGFNTELGGAHISAIVRADAGTTTADGTPSAEPGAGGRLQITFRPDGNSSTNGNATVRIALEPIGNWSWTGPTERTFEYDVGGAERIETFLFQVPPGSPEGARTFKVGLAVGAEGAANPLTVVVEEQADPTPGPDPTTPDRGEGIPGPGMLVATAALATALALRRRRE